MKKTNIALKNFAAGRKALFKRILLYGGWAIAFYEAVNIIINESNTSAIFSQYPVYQKFIYPVLNNLFFYIAVAVIFALIAQKSFSSYSKKIANTDISVHLQVGDIFANDGGIVVPSNNLFAHDEKIIGTKSIQYQLNSKCASGEYTCDKTVQDQIQAALDTAEFKDAVLPLEPQVLCGDSYNIYPYGMIIPVTVRRKKKEKHFYLLSMSQIKSEGKPYVNNKHLMLSIDGMWKNIQENRLTDNTLVVPVMGTGAANMTEKPKHIIAKYLIKTFADNASHLGIKNFVLSIYPDDYLNDEIDMDELRSYVDYVCRFPDSEFVVSE